MVNSNDIIFLTLALICFWLVFDYFLGERKILKKLVLNIFNGVET